MADKHQSHGTVGFHTYTQEEKTAFANFINNSIGNNEYLVQNNYLPINPNDDSIFKALRDGEVFSYFLQYAVPGVIEPEKLMIRAKGGKALNPF